MPANPKIKGQSPEVEQLKAKLKKKSLTIRHLKKDIKEYQEYITFLIAEIKEVSEIAPETDPEEAEAEEELKKQVEKVFGKTLVCTTCKTTEVFAFSFCPICESGWAYCKKCGGFEKAKKENLDHTVPTHGLFIDMFELNISQNSKKPN